MHQKRTNKLFLLNTWRMALSTKRAFFCSFLNVVFLEKVICTFCLAKCIRKGKKNCSFWLHEEWLSTKITSFVLFALPNASEKDNKFVPFLTSWRMALTTKRTIILFLSELHLSKKERHLYFLPCQMHQKRTKKLFLLTTWRMALTTKWTFFFVLFWTSSFSKKNVICTFCLAKCIRKGQTNCSFWLHEEWLSPQKEQFFLFFSERHLSRKKNVICTFCLAKCIRKGPKNCSFSLHEEWLSLQKEQFFCSFLNVIFLEKNVICSFCLAKCIRKGQKNCSFWLHEEWLSPQKEQFFLFLS